MSKFGTRKYESYSFKHVCETDGPEGDRIYLPTALNTDELCLPENHLSSLKTTPYVQFSPFFPQGEAATARLFLRFVLPDGQITPNDIKIKCRSYFRGPGKGLRVCISNNLPDDTYAAGPKPQAK